MKMRYPDETECKEMGEISEKAGCGAGEGGGGQRVGNVHGMKKKEKRGR